jgi:hypothetical protein
LVAIKKTVPCMYSMYIEYCTDIKGPWADIAIIEKVKEKG